MNLQEEFSAALENAKKMGQQQRAKTMSLSQSKIPGLKKADPAPPPLPVCDLDPFADVSASAALVTPAPAANIVPAVTETDLMRYRDLQRKITAMEEEKEAIAEIIKSAYAEGTHRIGAWEFVVNDVIPSPRIDWEGYMKYKTGQTKQEFIQKLMQNEATAEYVKKSKPQRKLMKVENVG